MFAWDIVQSSSEQATITKMLAKSKLAGVAKYSFWTLACGPYFCLFITPSANTLIVCAMTLSLLNNYVGVYICMCSRKHVKPLEQFYCLQKASL